MFIDFVGAQNVEHLPDNFDFSLRMDKSVWNFKGSRTANQPDKRITGISYLLTKTVPFGLVPFSINKIKNVGAIHELPLRKIHTETNQQAQFTPSQIAKSSLNKIMDFKGIGIQRKREMFFNIIFPFIMAFLNDKEPEVVNFLNLIFHTHPPISDNSVTKKFKYLIVA